MKKVYKKIIILSCMVLSLAFCLTACKLFGGNNEKGKKERLGVGEVMEYVASIASPNAVIVSSDETVLKIISQKYITSPDVRLIYTVQGLKEGNATVSVVDANGKTREDCTFTVKYEETMCLGEGNLVDNIEVDKTTAEVYRDDTLITYTITTSSSVDKLELTQVSHRYQKYFFDDLIEEAARTDMKMVYDLNQLVVDEYALTDEIIENTTAGTRYSATRNINGNKAIWTVKWDMGDTAVRFVRINAFDTSSGNIQTNYVKLNITYPVISVENGFSELVKLFVKYNLTEPLMFKTDTLSSPNFSEDIRAFRNLSVNFSEHFNNTAIYGGNSIEYLTRYSTIIDYSIFDFVDSETSEKLSTEFFGDRILLCDDTLQGLVYSFYEPITDELRAVIAYQNGWEIDEELFPYAYSILEKASAVLDEIITNEMTDFEKEKAIYTWLYEQGMNGLTNNWTPIPEGLDETKVAKTSYGVLNNYGGDCMGWSGTFYTLCNMAGIDCVTVDVKTTAGGATESYLPDHRINMIRLDGEYYFVEAFWSWQKTDASEGTYRYMNLNTEKASMLYSWSTEENGGPFVCNYENFLVNAYTGELLNK